MTKFKVVLLDRQNTCLYVMNKQGNLHSFQYHYGGWVIWPTYKSHCRLEWTCIQYYSLTWISPGLFRICGLFEVLIMKIEAAFSASPQNTDYHVRLLLYCFITQREKFHCYSLYIRLILNDVFQSSSRSTVLIVCARADILSGIHRIFKSDTLWNISRPLNASAKIDREIHYRQLIGYLIQLCQFCWKTKIILPFL